ncbi:MAG TPA: F0F1 ATP synthase subunit B [Bacteroidales bacterium]|nr:F0F1 ATP synthase subunit B [Bacteroidales bacterium]HRZ22294.1 F0F1 ATP synthase subunit B [Bacteroidales bacterium]
MELITPGIGLIFWMTLSFLLLLFVLGKYAWKPVMKALKKREDNIEDALRAAERTRQEMKELKSEHLQLLAEARDEKDRMLRDAKAIKESIIEKARTEANAEYNRIIESAKESIHYEKMAAITDLKNQLAQLSIEIAEKVLTEELSRTEKQKHLINKLIDEVDIN